MIVLNEIENSVLEIIKQHVGEDNAINDGMIRDLITVPDTDKRKPTAGLREVINSLRQKECPICSGVRGYWYAKDASDLYVNIQALDGRALKIMSATKGMRIALARLNNNGQGSLI